MSSVWQEIIERRFNLTDYRKECEANSGITFTPKMVMIEVARDILEEANRLSEKDEDVQVARELLEEVNKSLSESDGAVEQCGELSGL